MSDYKVKYQLHFHTFNKTVEEKLEITNGTSFFDGERNRYSHNGNSSRERSMASLYFCTLSKMSKRV